MYPNKRMWSRQPHQEKLQHLPQDLTFLRNFSLPKKWLPPLKSGSLCLGLKKEERSLKPYLVGELSLMETIVESRQQRHFSSMLKRSISLAKSIQ